MRRRRLSLVACGLAALLLSFARPSAALEVPYLAQRVTDLANLLPIEAESRLEAKLKTLESETGAQVAVLTVPSLEGEVIEDFSLRVAETWQLGRETQDDGVLVLVARDDRRVRIEVGYGLEGAITDLQSRRIIDGLMVPRFRQGDFAGGIEAAVNAVAGAVRGESDAIPPEPSSACHGGQRRRIDVHALRGCHVRAVCFAHAGAWRLVHVALPDAVLLLCRPVVRGAHRGPGGPGGLDCGRRRLAVDLAEGAAVGKWRPRWLGRPVDRHRRRFFRGRLLRRRFFRGRRELWRRWRVGQLVTTGARRDDDYLRTEECHQGPPRGHGSGKGPGNGQRTAANGHLTWRRRGGGRAERTAMGQRREGPDR